MMHRLEADGVQFEVGGKQILSSVYLKSETGKITALLGRNGQGKSCLLKIIYGTLKSEKSIRIDNIRCDEAFKRPDLLSYLPQLNFIPKSLSLKRIFSDFSLSFSSFSELFPEFVDKHRFSIGTLSGGERRLVELYVIIKSPSAFALLDEPFTYLSPIQIEKVKSLLLDEKKNKGFLITDHKYKTVLEISDSIYVLVNGKTYSVNSVSEIEQLGYVKI